MILLSLKKMSTRILKYSPDSLQECSKLIAQGKLVGMPTETVYGLGANALDAEACKSIFTTKGRPLTDPLIVHVCSVDQALSLIDQKQENATNILDLFQVLATQFWPGPLTIVVKANLDIIPSLITAETGFVGLGMPSNPIALELIRESKLPIAAPSANKFGHVSPSKAEHVYNDFHKDSEVTILDGGPCSFGIESTVLKINQQPQALNEFELLILRKGGVSEKALYESMESA
jgi:tRNA threonylcarbamoyl adenosine modification protein (Sua5/YciO/YrdC/YwlC family)